MKIKGLLFDKDGTLIDFNHTWLPLYQQAAEYLANLSQNGVTAEEIMRKGGYLHASNSWQADSLLASGSNQQIFAHWQQLTGLSIDGKTLAGIDLIFNQKNHSYRALVPDPEDYLLTLKKRGYKIGVATMDDEHHARYALESLSILDKIDFICGADSGFGLKPEAGMLNAFCQSCSLEPREVAMIGDSPRDLQMAINAGSPHGIAVLSGASTIDSLQAFAKHILPSIYELPELLARIEIANTD